jgi:archaea-specific RecJ-like exonuclease
VDFTENEFSILSEVKMKSISNLTAGDEFNGVVKITRKVKPGPVIFVITDGTKSMDAVIKDSVFEVDDVVNLRGFVSERAGKVQIDILSISKSNQDFSAIIEAKSKPIERPTSIVSDRYKLLGPYFYKIAQRIRKAVLENQPIMIRHHADTDGISAGLSLEQSIAFLMEDAGIDMKYSLYRSPSKAPFYETMDMLRDISLAKRLTDQFGQKKPIIIITDNGSTPEDTFALKSLHALGYEVIVIDHHNPVVLDKQNKKTGVCQYLTLHLNPYMEGLDGRICAGMLCHETARLISEKYDNKLIPAVSGISDRCEIPETDAYIALTGKSKDALKKIGIAIDFVSYNLRFDAGEGIYEELFNNEVLVGIIHEQVTKNVETQLQSTLPYLKTQDFGSVVYSHIDLEKYMLRFSYPTAGKVLGYLHDIVSEQNKQRPVITIGYLSDMIVVRATQPVLPVAKIIEELQKKFPEANVDGGGHECAGSIKFVSAHLEAIVEYVKEMVKGIKVME